MTHPNNLDRKSGMFVPEHYFEDFERQMTQRIDAYEAQRLATPVLAASSQPTMTATPGGLHSNLRRRIAVWISVAACVGLLIGLLTPWHPSVWNSVSAETEPMAESIVETQEQMEQNMMLASVSDYDIYEYLFGEE